MKNLVLAIALTLFALPCPGWGEKGHYIANEAATHGVPYEMPAFFHDSYPALAYLGYEPDRWRGAGPSLNASSPEHFLDYEFVSHLGPLPASRSRYFELLISSGTLDRYGIRMSTPGLNPWRIAEICEMLTRQWRLWRFEDNPIEKRQIEGNIVHLAGILGHYVADSANPHHSTIYYNGWTGPNPNGYRYDCRTHSRFESQFVTMNVVSSDVTPLLAQKHRRDNYFEEAVGFIKSSNDQLETLYALDRDGAFDGTGTKEGHEFARKRLSVAASRTILTSPCTRYLRPPCTIFEDLLDVPEAKSRASTRHTDNPRSAASRAIPAPVIPPPITRTSKVSPSNAAKVALRSRRSRWVPII